jgi:ABC-type bacteriocin/lantibiotic exporter with double-glycine peptidase domain
MTLTDNPVVLALWWIALVLTIIVIVPAALYLLHRTWRAARTIQRLTAETLEAGAGIAGHTAALPALDETIAAAAPVLERATRLEQAAARLERLLRARNPRMASG